MLKLVVKIIAFFILFTLCLSFLDEPFKEKRISYFSKKIYDEMDMNVEIGIFGNSHGLNGWDPRFFQKEFGKNTYNFSTAGQRLVSTLPALDEILSENDMELIIFDIHAGSIQDLKMDQIKSLQFQYNTLDNLDMSWPKIDAHNKLFGPVEIMNIFPAVRRHSKWVELVDGTEHILDQSSDFNNGYFARLMHSREFWDRRVKTINRGKASTLPRESLKTEEKENIDKLVAKFNEYKVPYLFVSAPFHLDTIGLNAKTHHRLIIDHLKKKGYPIVDINEKWDDFNFSLADFTDHGHLNSRGSAKISQYLTEYIKDKYEFSEKKIDRSQLRNNRYAIVDNTVSDILYTGSVDSLSPLGKLGVRKMHMFKSYTNKFEILFEGDSTLADQFTIRMEYNFNDAEEKKIDRLQKKYIESNNRIAQKIVLSNEIEYNERILKVFQFHSVFDDITNFKLYLIDGKNRTEVLFLDQLNLNNAN